MPSFRAWAKLLQKIVSCCIKKVFLDFSYVADEIIIQNPDNFEEQFRDVASSNVSPIPVIYLSMEREYTEKVLKIANDCQNGLCIRIENEDFEEDNHQKQLESLFSGFTVFCRATAHMGQQG